MYQDTFCDYFESMIPSLRKQIMVVFSQYGAQSRYRSVWEHFEDVINPVIGETLTNYPFNIPESNISFAQSKSTYPDIQVNYMGRLYAIDVKSGESSKKEPWYDISRLDTYEESHLNIYTEEYSIVVRWKDKSAPQVVDVYIEPTFKTVGYREEYDGVLYRPYDGKIRPKSWTDFENGYTQWRTKEDFIIGLQNAKSHFHNRHILNWYNQMTEAQRHQLRDELDSMDDDF